ncbi:MAG: SMI1/KNR4 family protein [Gemmatimonadota bacterium]
MTNSESSEVFTRIRQDSTAVFGAGAEADEVGAVEAALGVKLPTSFVAFLLEFGWGGAGDLEVFGCGKDTPAHLDLVRVTASERAEARPALPQHLVPIANDGMGNHYCLDVAGWPAEAPIVFWNHEDLEDQELEVVAPSFGHWLSDAVGGPT